MDNNYQQNPQNGQQPQPPYNAPQQAYYSQQPQQVYYSQQPQQMYYAQQPEAPAKGMAIASLVMGIISVVFWFFGVTAIVSLILGVVGLILAGKAKQQGNNTGMRTAGFVLSLIGTIVGGLIFIAAISCVGTAACAACASESAYYSSYYY